MLGSTGPRSAEGDYDVIDLLELSGGQGFVFRARLTSDRLGAGMLGTEVSLKQLIDGAVGVDRIRELDEVIRPRTHPRLSRQLEVFEGPPITTEGDEDADDTALTYVAAVWVHGETVDRAAPGRPLDTILRWVRQVAEAIDFLHADCHRDGPVLHRDIKPSNVIVDQSDNAVLIDPGLARPVVAGATGTPHGSPGYIPPEAQGGLRPSTAAGDRWQLAALCFCLLVGEPPGRMPIDEIRQRLTKAVAPTHRPGPIVDLLVAMLDPDPGSRPPAAAEWAGDLRVAAAGAARRAGVRRHERIAGAAVAVLALLAAGGLGYLVHSDRRLPEAHASGFLPSNSTVPHRLGLGRDVVVDNKVTNGPTAMREDVPAYLSTVPEDFCLRSGCALADTDVTTGTELTAVCQTVGQQTTNGDNVADLPGTHTAIDATNPGRYNSFRWYGITLPDRRHGYLWEGWLVSADRGGLDLPQC